MTAPVGSDSFGSIDGTTTKINPVPGGGLRHADRVQGDDVGGDSAGHQLEHQGSSAEQSAANQQQEGDPRTDVGAVVLKAKRAASSLWLLIHAQNCPRGGVRCPHKGCSDAKLILLHLKTCPAGAGFDCPQRYNGCNQARKLLAHHRRCRDIRARQAGVHPSRRAPTSQQHSCLVCSLVARHARNVLEGGRTPSPSGSRRTANSNKKVLASFTLPNTTQDSTVVIPNLRDSPSRQMMPPPPPRFPPASAPLKIHDMRATNRNEMTICESPPTTDQLMRHEFSAVAAAAGPSPLFGGSIDTSLLGKSLDSSRSSYLRDGPPVPKHSNLVNADRQPVRRPRSESYDATSVSKFELSRQPSSHVAHEYSEFDPTLENTLRIDIGSKSVDTPLGVPCRRARSASLGVISTTNRLGGCDTIVEEGSSLDSPTFLNDDETEG